MNAGLKSLLSNASKLCIVGIGNRMKGDDAAGPMLIDLLDGRTKATCIDAGVAPENYLEKIVAAKPDVVLLWTGRARSREGKVLVGQFEDLGYRQVDHSRLPPGTDRVSVFAREPAYRRIAPPSTRVAHRTGDSSTHDR